MRPSALRPGFSTMVRFAPCLLAGTLLAHTLLAGTMGCGNDTASGPPVTATYDLARGAHFFAAPFPSDILRKTDGTIDLPRFPEVDGFATGIFKGYVRRFGTSVYGFGLNTGLYQKFSGPVDVTALDRMKDSAPKLTDPVLLMPIAAQSAAELVPLDVRFIADPEGDPYLTPNLLLANPRLTAPLRGATAYAFVVRTDSLRAKSGGAVTRDPAFEAIFSERDGVNAAPLQIRALKETLTRVGIAHDKIASVTVFTTQDVDRQLEAIRTRVEASLRDDHLELRNFREVSRIAYSLGMTMPNNKPAAMQTVSFVDGSSETTELSTETMYPQPVRLDTGTFPYRVFEGRLRTLNLQGVNDKPFGTPGLGLVTDAALDTGQIRFQRGPEGRLTVSSTPETEDMRIVIAVPLDGQRRPFTRAPVVFWDHGTGGSAYDMVLDSNGAFRSLEILSRYAAHRAILVARDQPLFGQRFPKRVDRGFNDFLVAYNIANITAFRDNLRQSAVDNLVTWRFVRDKLNALFTAQQISAEPVADTTKLFRFGHSLGSVTTHLATAFLPPQTFTASLVNGSGGLLTLYLLESGLLPRFAMDPDNGALILMALNIDTRATLTPQELIGGLAGVPRGNARARIKRDHPVITLAQTILDPADPLNYARRLTLPIHVVRGTGDLQVPNSATDALTGVLPMATVKRCDALGGRTAYDPHHCMFREDAGLAAINAFLTAFLPIP